MVVESFRSDEQPCAYLPARQAIQEYSITPRLNADAYERMMNEGYRKFGIVVFKPVCGHCNACRPIRVCVEEFHMDRSQRRCDAVNRGIDVRVSPPQADAERVELYNRYHAARTGHCGWEPQSIDLEQYAQSFVLNPIPTCEVSVWVDGKLAGICCNDVTPHTVSAIYHFYDPDLPQRSLGTYLILQTIALAKMMGKPWVYLGYHVVGCRSMEYKRRYKPYEIMGVDGVWRRESPSKS
jgi:leucyl-tRNA---protein transferase